MKTILIAEDSKTQALMLGSVLTKAGYQVLTVNNGTDALETIKTNASIDLIITDIRMPGMNGYDVAWAIKNNPCIRHVPVMLFSGLSETKDIIMGLESLADCYIIKPFEADEVLHHVSILLDNPDRLTEHEPLTVKVEGQEYPIFSNRRQILSFLLSIYDSAIRRNRQLQDTQAQLQLLNDKLAERTIQLEESEMRFRSLVETVPDLIYRIDPEGKFIFVNQSIRKLGYTPEELVGQHFSALFSPQQADLISRNKVLPEIMGQAVPPPKLFDERRTGKRRTTGLEVLVKYKESGNVVLGHLESLTDGYLDMEINSTGMYQFSGHSNNPVFIGTVGVIRDITLRKQTELALEDARIKADKANKAKSEFLSRMSHELRTPLNAILGFSQLLTSDEEGVLTVDQIDSVDEIQQAGRHLLDLIDEILDLSKIEAGRTDFKMTTLPPKELFDECNAIAQMLAQKHKVEFAYEYLLDDTVIINTDARRLKQILLNLISNAINYNHEEGSVTLICEALDPHILSISVADTGCGIPEQDLSEVFKPFSRSSNVRHIEGTGIGLTITKQLVDLMGGKISVKSEVGKGSVFSLELPIIA
jgi:PAS domain S-box-containing protein